MTRVLVFDQRQEFSNLLKQQLEASDAIESCWVDDTTKSVSTEKTVDSSSLTGHSAIGTLVYSPRCIGSNSATLDLDHARKVFTLNNLRHLRHVVLLSSAAVYHPRHGNPGLITESRSTVATTPNAYANQWRLLELIAEQCSSENIKFTLTVLRPAPTLIPSARDYVSRMIQRRLAIRFLGHDPSIQLLSAQDLARAILCVITKPVGGIFNVAPRAVVPLRKAQRQARVRGFAMPRLAQRPIRSLFRSLGAAPIDEADFIRYSFTVSGESLRRTLGFEPTKTSAQALTDYIAESSSHADQASWNEEFDDFGLDNEYLEWHGRWLFRFLERIYWRVDVRGVENIPAQDGAILVGIHRGFMPFDGVLLVHILNRYADRVPRILLHPSLVKFPVLAEFLVKIGGVIACQPNADYVLNRGDILGVFPEGIRGAFRMYRDAYRLDRMGRNDYVKFALKHQVPIVPFVYLGPAEAFPILARIDWPWWKRVTEWPFFPITPTWPWLPLPLPSKWHLKILEPISLTANNSPADAENPRVVETIANQVREAIRRDLNDMRSRRKSVFWGSICSDADDQFSTSPDDPAPY
jgi:1-acyl-sn-glycerol-3-phosphate acyltransferase/nucleoside-diphosphate-sugar epimerase